MNINKLQDFSVQCFTSLGRLLQSVQDWILRHPRLSNWIFRTAENVEADAYAANNQRAFSNYGEQERMLADGPRMSFYREMIKRKIQPGDTVVDLGTGTGILAAYASKQGAARVYALDHSSILDDARRLAEHNGIRNVEFRKQHSRRFKVSEPVDVILHEQMGDILFDEDMVSNVLDLRDRVLKKGGQIYPAKFDFYCEPMQLSAARKVPFIWEMNLDGFDYSPLKSNSPEGPEYYFYTTTDSDLVDK